MVCWYRQDGNSEVFTRKLAVVIPIRFHLQNFYRTSEITANMSWNSTVLRIISLTFLYSSSQHFPMYRESDAECSEPDQAPEDEKTQKFRERWECLSKESSEQVWSCPWINAAFSSRRKRNSITCACVSWVYQFLWNVVWMPLLEATPTCNFYFNSWIF